MSQTSSRQFVTSEENGLNVIEYFEVVAALNEKSLQKTRAINYGKTF